MTETDAPPKVDEAKWSRRRVAVLVLVHIAIGLHIAHWKRTGRTIAPLELNEVVYTFAIGIVTAGFLLLLAAFIASAIFGRYFCSWACHILALQDTFHWLLSKLGIKLRPLRSRVLRWVPIVAAAYMFFLPLAARVVHEGRLPTFHFRSDSEGWASLVTSDFWRNLPGGWMVLTTFAVCGLVIVYALGSRSFCSSVCPYGALFGFADKIAPGRLVVRGDCSGCSRCTTVCSSHIRVHQELAEFGTIVDKNCLRDLDCMAACPRGNLRFAFTVPPILRGGGAWSGLPRKFDLSGSEELLLFVAGVAAFFALRGLYDLLPFLLSMALAVIFGAVVVTAARVLRRRDTRFQKLVLVQGGRIRPPGAVYASVGMLACLAVAHSGWIRWNEFSGSRALARAEAALFAPGNDDTALIEARERIDLVRRWGWIDSRPARLRQARAAELAGDLQPAERTLAALHDERPDDRLVVVPLARVQAARGEREQAAALLAHALSLVPEIQHDRADAMQYLAEVHAMRGEMAAHDGDFELARTHLERACEFAPSSGLARYQLGVVYMALGRKSDASTSFERATELLPTDVDARNNLAFLLMEQGRAGEAERHLRIAVRLAPRRAALHLNLGRALLAQDRRDEARPELMLACQLDKRFTDTVRQWIGE